MTDEHGSESQPVHEEEVPAEEQPAQDAEAGVWADDHPPVDDFADSGMGTEDVATVSQEAAPEADETAPADTGRSRSMLPLFAAIGGILVLGAVVYWEFGRSPPSPSPATIIAQSMTKKPPAIVPLSPKPSIPAMPSVTPPASPPSSAPPSPTSAAEADITALKTTPEPSAQPSAPTETAPTTAMVPIPPPVVPPQNISSASAAAAEAEQTRIDSLTARIDDLQKSLDQATKQLNQVSNMVAANQAMPPVSNQTSPALEDRLGKIEQSLMRLEHDEAAKPLAPAAMPETVMAPQSVVKTASSRPATSVKHKYTHKHIHKKPKAIHRESQPAPARTAGASSSWVLRAATPSEAWVSTDMTSPELRHVQVGDVLSGIGRVRAIRQTVGGWEIEGTDGSVR